MSRARGSQLKRFCCANVLFFRLYHPLSQDGLTSTRLKVLTRQISSYSTRDTYGWHSIASRPPAMSFTCASGSGTSTSRTLTQSTTTICSASQSWSSLVSALKVGCQENWKELCMLFKVIVLEGAIVGNKNSLDNVTHCDSIPTLLKCSISSTDVRSALTIAMVLSGVTSFLISYGSAWCVRCTSSTTYSMVGALNKLPVAASGILFLGDPATTGNVVGILLGFLAGLLYSYSKSEQSQKNFALANTASLSKSARSENDPSTTAVELAPLTNPPSKSGALPLYNPNPDGKVAD